MFFFVSARVFLCCVVLSCVGTFATTDHLSEGVL
jgi:hypothetical protein